MANPQAGFGPKATAVITTAMRCVVIGRRCAQLCADRMRFISGEDTITAVLLAVRNLVAATVTDGGITAPGPGDHPFMVIAMQAFHSSLACATAPGPGPSPGSGSGSGPSTGPGTGPGTGPASVAIPGLHCTCVQRGRFVDWDSTTSSRGACVACTSVRKYAWGAQATCDTTTAAHIPPAATVAIATSVGAAVSVVTQDGTAQLACPRIVLDHRVHDGIAGATADRLCTPAHGAMFVAAVCRLANQLHTKGGCPPIASHERALVADILSAGTDTAMQETWPRVFDSGPAALPLSMAHFVAVVDAVVAMQCSVHCMAAATSGVVDMFAALENGVVLTGHAPHVLAAWNMAFMLLFAARDVLHDIAGAADRHCGAIISRVLFRDTGVHNRHQAGAAATRFHVNLSGVYFDARLMDDTMPMCDIVVPSGSRPSTTNTGATSKSDYHAIISMCIALVAAAFVDGVVVPRGGISAAIRTMCAFSWPELRMEAIHPPSPPPEAEALEGSSAGPGQIPGVEFGGGSPWQTTESLGYGGVDADAYVDVDGDACVMDVLG